MIINIAAFISDFYIRPSLIKDMKKMSYYCYANGKIIRKNDIKVGIADLVMLRGYGVFDFLRTYNGMPFRINDYLARFTNSAHEMHLKCPVSKQEIIRIIHSLLKKNKAGEKIEFGIRLLLTGGYSLDSYLPAKTPNFFILIEDLPEYPDWYSTKGIKLMLHDFEREIPQVKTINYMTAIRLAKERKKHHAQDTLYSYNGKILETTRNNFFLFRGDTLVTSKDSILNGVTRKTILKIAAKMFKIEIRDMLKNELSLCGECFVTGTTRGITPVVQIDGQRIGNGRVGENTKKLMKVFAEFVLKESK